MRGLVIVALLSLCSFKKDDINSGQSFYATVNGEIYQVRNSPFLEIAEPNSATIGATNAQIVKVNFPGAVYTLRNNQPFTENLQFMFGFTNSEVDTNYYVGMQYQGDYYYVVKDESKMELSQLDVSVNNSSAVVSAKYDCVLRNFNYRVNHKKDIRIVGTMNKLNVHLNELSANR